MGTKDKISIRYSSEEKVNGLGMMIGQYLEQNLADSPKKVKQGLRLKICTAIEVDKGISITIHFSGDIILIKNGVADDVELFLKSNYLNLADVLSGKASPILEVVKGNVKIARMPVTKLRQVLLLLNFLKIPDDLMVRDAEI